MLYLGQRGFRVIAHDSRGHGRSGQTWTGNNMDTYADDLAELFEKLDLNNVTMAGHSTGGGEVARYIGRHGSGQGGSESGRELSQQRRGSWFPTKRHGSPEKTYVQTVP
jgi:alpha-beta hydrolase superfamily lysophospholipase